MLEKIEINYDQLAEVYEDIAHELRAPLNNLVGQTQIMLMQSRSQQELEQLLYSHLEEYERLSKMIDNMLFIARSEHSDYIIEKENIDLSNLILELVHYFEFLAEDKQMTFVLALEKGIQIYANADLLKRALSNLIINAIDYGFEDQDIVTSTKSTENHVNIEILTKNVFKGREKHELLGRMADMFPRFQTGLELLNLDEVYTEKGKDLYLELTQKCQKILDKYEKIKNEFDLSHRDLDFRYNEFCLTNSYEDFLEKDNNNYYNFLKPIT